MYTLGQAARATGKAKVTLARAVKDGRISASRGEDGTYRIDPAELERVYPLTGTRTGHAGHLERSSPPNGTGTEAGTAAAGEVVALHQRIAEQAETIRDLRGRLDAEAEERRQTQAQLGAVQAQLTASLTDQRPARDRADPPAGLWGRFRAWRRGGDGR
jgi:uncharacterized coiled-coil protein SlyX